MEEVITYEYLDPETLEPDPEGQLFRITQIGEVVIHEAVNGTLDPDTGEFIPAPYVPPEPILSDTDILGQQLVEKDLQILDLQTQNAAIGFSLVALELRLLALEGGASE